MKLTKRQLRRLIRESINTSRVDEGLFGYLSGMFGGKKPYSELTTKELNSLWRKYFIVVNSTGHSVNALGMSASHAADQRAWLEENISDNPLEVRDFIMRYKSWLKSPDFLLFKKTPEYTLVKQDQADYLRKDLYEGVSHKEVKMSEIRKAVRKCLQKEGGAAGMDLLIKCVKKLQTKTKKLPEKCRTNKEIAKCILKMDFVVKHRYEDIILTVGLPKGK